MPSTALQSTPAASSELAIAAVNGMIGQAGAGKIVKVLNIDVREVNGEYIAVAMIQIDEPEVEDKQKQDFEDKKEADEKNIVGKDDPENTFVEPYYLSSHTSEAESAFPDAGEGPAAPEPDNQHFVDNNTGHESHRDEQHREAMLQPETLSPQEEKLSEKVRSDFESADPVAAYNVDPQEIIAERLADKPLEEMSERELRELRAEVEQRLQEMPQEAKPAADDAQEPGMAA